MGRKERESEAKEESRAVKSGRTVRSVVLGGVAGMNVGARGPRNFKRYCVSSRPLNPRSTAWPGTFRFLSQLPGRQFPGASRRPTTRQTPRRRGKGCDRSKIEAEKGRIRTWRKERRRRRRRRENRDLETEMKNASQTVGSRPLLSQPRRVPSKCFSVNSHPVAKLYSKDFSMSRDSSPLPFLLSFLFLCESCVRGCQQYHKFTSAICFLFLLLSKDALRSEHRFSSFSSSSAREHFVGGFSKFSSQNKTPIPNFKRSSSPLASTYNRATSGRKCTGSLKLPKFHDPLERSADASRTVGNREIIVPFPLCVGTVDGPESSVSTAKEKQISSDTRSRKRDNFCIPAKKEAVELDDAAIATRRLPLCVFLSGTSYTSAFSSSIVAKHRIVVTLQGIIKNAVSQNYLFERDRISSTAELMDVKILRHWLVLAWCSCESGPSHSKRVYQLFSVTFLKKKKKQFDNF